MGQIKYLLDTNILSEPARQNPDAVVMSCFKQYDGKYATASIVWHELKYGIELLPDSKRKTYLQSYLSVLLENGLAILPFDQNAAEWYAKQRARIKIQGKTTAYADGEIAAIAAVNNLTLITRNTSDFQHYKNIEVVNWFKG